MELRKTWLEDKDGNKVSPNTLFSQVYNEDGTRVQESMAQMQQQIAETFEQINTKLGGKASQSDIPTNLSDLNGDSDHRTVTDAEKEKWNQGGDTTVPSVTYEEYMNNLDLYKDKIVGIEDKDGVAVANLVDYDNTESGLEATNVQEAIDELANKQPSPSGDVAITDLVNWESVTTETLGGVDYKVMWQIAPTVDNDVYGLAISSNGLLAYIRSNKGAKSTSLTTYSQNTCSQMYNGSSATGAVKYPTMSNYELIPNSYTMINFFNGNTYKGLVKINCNGKGAVPLYLNGEITSATNYEIPKGSYMMFYDGTNYYLRTDGKLPVEPEKFGGMTIQELQLGFIQYVNYAPNLKVEVEESTKKIQPRVFYNFTNPINGDLTITFGEFPSDPRLPQQNFANEYTFGFVAGTNCNLILPSDVKWLNRVPSLDQGNYYEVSVLNNRAVISIGVEA